MVTNNKISKLSDADLLANFASNKQPSTFAELYRRYIPWVYGLCLKYFDNPNDAHNAVKDIFRTALKLVSEQKIDNFYNWLYNIAKSYCITKTNKIDKSRSAQTSLFDMEPDANNTSFTMFDRVLSTEEEKSLSACMNKLDYEQQKCIRLFYDEKKSYADISDVTGYDIESVQNYIQSGKMQLKKCIDKTFGHDNH